MDSSEGLDANHANLDANRREDAIRANLAKCFIFFFLRINSHESIRANLRNVGVRITCPLRMAPLGEPMGPVRGTIRRECAKSAQKSRNKLGASRPHGLDSLKAVITLTQNQRVENGALDPSSLDLRLGRLRYLPQITLKLLKIRFFVCPKSA